MRLLKSLKILLRSNYLYVLLFIIALIYILMNTVITKHSSKYTGQEGEFVAVIGDISIDGDLLRMELRAEERLIGSYYFKTEEEKTLFSGSYELGDVVCVRGNLTGPSNNANPNMFNYKKYLYRNKMFYLLEIENISLVNKNKNIFFSIKNMLIKRIDSLNKSSDYVYAFVLGDSSNLDREVKSTYRDIGIVHLFSISGMHIGMFSAFLLWLFKPLGNKKYGIVIILLLVYLVLINFVVSAIRAVLLFALITINKLLKLGISSFKLLLLTIFIIIFLNPFIIYNIGFQYSCIVSGFLMVFSDKINCKTGYFSKLFVISYIAFLAGMPISLYNFFELNLLTVLNNLIFVPFVTFILFPLSLLTLVLPFLDGILFGISSIMEWVSRLLSFDICSFVFIKLDVYIYIVYYLIIYLALKNRGCLIVLGMALLLHTNYNMLFKSDYMLMIDVGQGDSFLFHSNNKTILIDTGGRVLFKQEAWRKRETAYDMANDTLIPIFKSLGIKKLDYLCLTHGDFDHMGEAEKIVNNFVVRKVLFNNYELNELEKRLIDVLEQEGINYQFANNGDKLKVGNFEFLVGIKEYNNENDNSIVMLVKRISFKFLLMGDAGVDVEKDLMEDEFMGMVDVLKLGHHGSKTSTSEALLEFANPQIALVSAGRNNRYNHPNKEVMDRLKDRNVFVHSTQDSGAFLIKFKDRVSIFTFVP